MSRDRSPDRDREVLHTIPRTLRGCRLLALRAARTSDQMTALAAGSMRHVVSTASRWPGIDIATPTTPCLPTTVGDVHSTPGSPPCRHQHAPFDTTRAPSPGPRPWVGDVFLGTNPGARPGPNSVFQITADHTQPVPAPPFDNVPWRPVVPPIRVTPGALRQCRVHNTSEYTGMLPPSRLRCPTAGAPCCTQEESRIAGFDGGTAP